MPRSMMIPSSSSSPPSEGVVGEKTPLLISVATDITVETAAVTVTTPSTNAPSPKLPPLHGGRSAASGTNNNNNNNRHHQQQQRSSSSSYLNKKAEDIELLLSQPEIDLWKLRGFALTPGGLVNDTIRKRAWPKLVGLDHNYDPLPLDDIVLDKTNAINNDAGTTPASQSAAVVVPTIEIDAQHELLKKDREAITKYNNNKAFRNNKLPTSSNLIVESMDVSQIDRDVARCTWHLLTGSQRSRRSQHRAIIKNSTRGTGYARQRANTNNTNNHTNNKRVPRNSHRHLNSSKYRRNRKVAVLLKKKQNRLANLINLTLVQSYDRSDGKGKQNQPNAAAAPSPNRLRYYQGYHDVACIFLHALGGAGSNQTPQATNNSSTANNFLASSSSRHDRIYQHYSSGDLELPSKVLCQVSFSHFSDACRSDFLRLQTGLKLVLFPLLSKIDREVHDHLLDADMEPFFCLSWILTWFAHDVRDTNLVKRLFDAFLVGHPALPIYASLAMMTHPYNRQMIMETDCDFAALHQCLASLPKHSCKAGYKEKKVEGFDNVVVYVSDNEGDNNNNDDNNDTDTINTNTDNHSYLEEDQSEFDDDNDSHTFDSRSNYTSETIYTESSFPTSVDSNNSYSNNNFHSYNSTGGGPRAPTSIITGCSNEGGGSLASGSLASLGPDRTIVSTEEPDFLSKESTLVSGKWDENESWTGGLDGSSNDNGAAGGAAAGTPTSSMGGGGVGNDRNREVENASDAFAMGDHNPVPFETVLDTALQLMKTYPPSSLVALAKNYFRDDWVGQLTLLSSTTTSNNNNNADDSINVQELIGLLSPTPPAWSILPTASSDWIDKQKQRQDLGLKPTSRKDRRRRKQKKDNLNRMKKSTSATDMNNNNMHAQTTVADNRLTIDCGGAPSEDAEDDIVVAFVDPMEYVRANPEDRVVAAIGYGPGMEAKMRQRKLLRQQRRRRKRRRALMLGCGVVVIGAVAMYGGIKLVGNKSSSNTDNNIGGGNPNETIKNPPPLLRKLRAFDDDKSKKGGGEPRDIAASMILPRLKADLLTKETTHGIPPSPEKLESKTTALRPTGSNHDRASSSSPESGALERSSWKRTTKLAHAHHHNNDKGGTPQPILQSAIRKTKLFLTRFAHHLWIVCRGFVSPFKLLRGN